MKPQTQRKKVVVFLLLFSFLFLRFSTLKDLMTKFNALTRHQQATAKIVTQPGWNSAFVDWFLIYDEDSL